MKANSETELRFIIPKTTHTYRHIQQACENRGDSITQAYLNNDVEKVIRLRTKKNGSVQEAFMTVKGSRDANGTCDEFESPVAFDFAQSLLDSPYVIGKLQKLRSYPLVQGEPDSANMVNISCDYFLGSLEGLVILEIEYDPEKISADTAKKYVYDSLLLNVGAFIDITGNHAYSNLSLATNGLPED